MLKNRKTFLFNKIPEQTKEIMEMYNLNHRGFPLHMEILSKDDLFHLMRYSKLNQFISDSLLKEIVNSAMKESNFRIIKCNNFDEYFSFMSKETNENIMFLESYDINESKNTNRLCLIMTNNGLLMKRISDIKENENLLHCFDINENIKMSPLYVLKGCGNVIYLFENGKDYLLYPFSTDEEKSTVIDMRYFVRGIKNLVHESEIIDIINNTNPKWFKIKKTFYESYGWSNLSEFDSKTIKDSIKNDGLELLYFPSDSTTNKKLYLKIPACPSMVRTLLLNGEIANKFYKEKCSNLYNILRDGGIIKNNEKG